jgi:hypothetical protein
VTIPPPAPQCMRGGAGGGNRRSRLRGAEQYSVGLGAAVRFGEVECTQGSLGHAPQAKSGRRKPQRRVGGSALGLSLHSVAVRLRNVTTDLSQRGCGEPGVQAHAYRAPQCPRPALGPPSGVADQSHSTISRLIILCRSLLARLPVVAGWPTTSAQDCGTGWPPGTGRGWVRLNQRPAGILGNWDSRRSTYRGAVIPATPREHRKAAWRPGHPT